MYGHNRAWGHYFCPFLLVFMLTKMAFDGGKWLQCLSQSLTWPLGPGVFLRPVPSCTCGVSVLLQFYPSLCSESCWHFVFSYQKSKWSTWVTANCFVLFRLFVVASVVVCLPGFLFVSFVLFLMQDVKLTVSEMVCEIELWHRKWRALNTALMI